MDENNDAGKRLCPACGGEIPSDARPGICPRCVLRGVADEVVETEEATRTAAQRGMPPPSLDEISAAFPQFEVLELIGSGGMGAVFKVRQPRLERVVALKVLPRALASDAHCTERFTREARALDAIEAEQASVRQFEVLKAGSMARRWIPPGARPRPTWGSAKVRSRSPFTASANDFVSASAARSPKPLPARTKSRRNWTTRSRSWERARGKQPRARSHATISLMTRPATSVSRKRRPLCLKVSFLWSRPRRWRMVAWRSWISTLSITAR